MGHRTSMPSMSLPSKRFWNGQNEHTLHGTPHPPYPKWVDLTSILTLPKWAYLTWDTAPPLSILTTVLYFGHIHFHIWQPSTLHFSPNSLSCGGCYARFIGAAPRVSFESGAHPFQNWHTLQGTPVTRASICAAGLGYEKCTLGTKNTFLATIIFFGATCILRIIFLVLNMYFWIPTINFWYKQSIFDTKHAR